MSILRIRAQNTPLFGGVGGQMVKGPGAQMVKRQNGQIAK